MLNGLDLFSGIGGNTLALGEWIKTIAYCERDAYARSVLLSRMGDGTIPMAPIWDDVTTLRGDMFNLPIDIIVGGFPCQDISCAGKGAGLAGERSGLFFEIVRLAKELQPRFLFLENVGAIRTRGLDTVGRELADAGYDCRWGALSAFDMGAPHRRERWFLLAKSNGPGIRGRGIPEETCHLGGTSSTTGGARIRSDDKFTRPDNFKPGCENVANTSSNGRVERWAESEVFERKSLSVGGRPPIPNAKLTGLERHGNDPRQSKITEPWDGGWWEVEPDVGRVVDGLPKRVDRLRTLGNAVVPAQAREAFRRLMSCE